MQNWMWRVTLGPAYPQRICSQIFLCICRISSIIYIFIITWFCCKFNNCWPIQIIKLHMLSERNETPCINAVKKIFFSIWVFFYKHSQITGLQDFHLLLRHLDISRAITVQSSPLHIASSQTRTSNLWFLSTNRLSLSYAPLYTSYTIIKKVVSVEKLFIMIILFMSCLSKPSFIFLKTVMSCITNCYNWQTKIFQCFYSLPLPKIAFALEANLR